MSSLTNVLSYISYFKQRLSSLLVPMILLVAIKGQTGSGMAAGLGLRFMGQLLENYLIKFPFLALEVANHS